MTFGLAALELDLTAFVDLQASIHTFPKLP